MLSERVAQCHRLVDAIAGVVMNHVTSTQRVLRPEVANRVYALTCELHALLCTHILGDAACNADADELYADEATGAAVRSKVSAARQTLIGALMWGFEGLMADTQLLEGGRVALASLLLLCVAALQRLETDIDPRAADARSFTTDFMCARTYALYASDEQKTTPVEDLSVHATMNALHALYAATPVAAYSTELERYARVVVRRALALLLEPGPASLWNISAYRAEIGNDMYRFSSLLLRDITLVWHALSDHFDVAHLAKLNQNPRSVCAPSRDDIHAARQWLRRNAAAEMDTWVRDALVTLSMRAGEMDFYHAEHRAEHSTPHIVLRDHRVADYYRLMEAATLPSAQVVRAQLVDDGGRQTQRETLHLSLVVLSTFKAQLKATEKALDPTAFVVVGHELRAWAPYLAQCHERPLLVLMYNHMQVCFAGEMLMYNSALEALSAWMLLVDQRCNRCLDGQRVGSLIDDFLRSRETSSARVDRFAAINSVERPALGYGGVY
jgi:hypothetical protein